MFPRPPKIHAWGRAGGGAPVGVDEGAVEIDVGVSSQLRGEQYRVQRGLERGEDGDAFVEVAVGRR